ncbi:MAG: TonB-dependent receptor [Bacteroidales bacterium]|nr:TonB-dependent receptor [Bacteroidales bacterium]
MKRKIVSILLLAACLQSIDVNAQEALTREQILAMTTEELSELSLDQLMLAVETLGVSSVDELFALIMNKNVSSASKSEESSFTSPLATTVITHDELRMYGCTSIEEAFRLIPGMIVQQKTNGVYDVQLRGLNNIPDNNMLLYTENSNTVLLVDGRSVHNYGIGAFSPELLPISIEDVERIEVVRGAVSALYGANAVNGIVNIITRKPDQASALVAGGAQFGGHDTYMGDIALRRQFSDKFAAGISVNIQQRKRNTNKLRVLSSETMYLDKNDVVDPTASLTKAQLEGYFADGTLVPVECNTELSLEEYNHLRSVGYNTMTFAKSVYLPYMANIYGPQYVQMLMYQYGMTQEQAEQMLPVVLAQGIQLDVQNPDLYQVFNALPVEYRDMTKSFPDPSLARKTEGINGYLAFTPSTDVRIDLTGGYSQSLTNNSALVDFPYSMCFRQFKTGYVNADAHIKDFHLQVSYAGGSEDYCYGRPGFKIFNNRIFGTAEYSLNLGDADTWGALSIQPGVHYQGVFAEDIDQYYCGVKQPGFFDGSDKLTSIAPVLRLDYTKGKIRAIVGVRSDKTNIPDKWNTSAQAVLSYKLNEKNFIRMSYGRAMRSASLTAACCNYRWLRDSQDDNSGLGMPDVIQFNVNDNANIMHLDGLEFGYRVQPTPKLLIDAEVFYSKSTDYTSMMARSATSDFDMESTLQGAIKQETNIALSTMRLTGNIQFDNVPYKVSQYGFGMNIDWILSDKLIAKFNMNTQQTIIDDYYLYDRNKVMGELLKYASLDAMMVATKVTEEIMSITDIDQRREAAKAAYERLGKAGDDGRVKTGFKDVKDLDLTTDEDKAIYDLLNPELEDGHKHKATPAVYGMVGLLAKPNSKLNVSAYANFMGKREYLTGYGKQDLSPRMTLNMKVGYKPTEKFELFFNGSNILNNKKQEFVFGDEIGGQYNIGMSFSL